MRHAVEQNLGSDVTDASLIGITSQNGVEWLTTGRSFIGKERL